MIERAADREFGLATQSGPNAGADFAVPSKSMMQLKALQQPPEGATYVKHGYQGQGLTSDNNHISRPTTGSAEASDESEINCNAASLICEIDCTESLADRVADFVANSISENTRRAHRSDLAHFAEWGGSVPAAPRAIASYLAAHADELSVATLVRRVATLSKAHEARGLLNPCRSEIVRATLRGIKRTRGTAQQQAKPLVRDDLMLVLDRLGGTPKEARDRALLLLGFAGGFRRSELVGLDHADIEHVRQGLVITLRFSKTDQVGAGRRIGIPHGRTRHCPVVALDAWLALSGVECGPIFRPVDRHGNVSSERLSGEAVSLIIHERVAAAEIDPTGFSGHSLRAGFATSAAQAGVSALKIRRQTGHTSDAMLARYVRDGELFVGNAASVLL